jgi:hypothetical protein
MCILSSIDLILIKCLKFLIEFTNKYFIIHIDDYVLLQNDRYTLVKHLFTHDFSFDYLRRVFV